MLSRIQINISLYSLHFPHDTSALLSIHFLLHFRFHFSDFGSSHLMVAKYFPYQLVWQAMLHYAILI